MEFFKHENEGYPPSRSQFGKLRHGSKQDLAQLEKITESLSEASKVDALVIDGASLLTMLKPIRRSKMCEDYFKDINRR